MNKVIEIRECSAAYGENAVLHKVSLTIEQGELVVIIGPSGCGKTTLLKMINGIVTPTEGEVIVNGEALASCDLVALRRQIGYAVQGAKLFPHMTVRDNICYVPGLEKKMTAEEKQHLAGRMPEILLMDEPFGAVDEITRKGLQEELLSLQEKTGVTIVFITHDIDEAFKLGSRILIMKEGCIWQEGTAGELTEAPRDVFVRKLLNR